VTAPQANSEFKTERDAKEYLIARISAEAQQQGIEFTEVERKMLYFSATGWTLPDILDVNAEFERDYNNDEYESRIAGLARAIERKNSEKASDEQSFWDDAVEKLSEGDHYLLVLIRLARSAPAGELSKWLPAAGVVHKRPKGDFFRLMVVAFAVLVAIGVLFWLRDRL
jgi:hypothetical protein